MADSSTSSPSGTIPRSSTENYQRVTTGYQPRALQLELHKKLKRFSVLVLHRRAGKTVFSINEMIARGMRCPHPNPRCAYLAPLYSQAKRVAWDYLKQYTANLPGAVPNEADLRVDVPRPAPFNDTVRFTLLGADNPQSLRGIYLDFAILDEYADMNPSVWGEIIRPTLSDRKGRALFIGTPKGRNNFWSMYDRALNGFPKMTEDGSESQEERKVDPEWFGALYKASETGLLSDKELESARRDMNDDDLFEQEYECSFLAGLTGAYYAKQMAYLEANARIRDVPHDPALLVDTFWDLGVNDTTCIIFTQTFGNEIRVIDYIEDSGQGIAFYIKKLKERGYTYGRNWLPHDAAARDLSTGKSRIETAKALGLQKIKLTPKLDIEDGIHAARNTLPRCVFDEKKTRRLRECLIAYQKRWDSKNLIFSSTPLHNWASNGADAFRYLSVSHRDRDYSPKGKLPTHAETNYNVFGS